jgi:hypothetical protein
MVELRSLRPLSIQEACNIRSIECQIADRRPFIADRTL